MISLANRQSEGPARTFPVEVVEKTKFIDLTSHFAQGALKLGDDFRKLRLADDWGESDKQLVAKALIDTEFVDESMHKYFEEMVRLAKDQTKYALRGSSIHGSINKSFSLSALQKRGGPHNLPLGIAGDPIDNWMKKDTFAYRAISLAKELESCQRKDYITRHASFLNLESDATPKD